MNAKNIAIHAASKKSGNIFIIWLVAAFAMVAPKFAFGLSAKANDDAIRKNDKSFLYMLVLIYFIKTKNGPLTGSIFNFVLC